MNYKTPPDDLQVSQIEAQQQIESNLKSVIDVNSTSDSSINKLVIPKKRNIDDEKWWHTLLQVAIPFLIAGFGTIGAGIVLGRVDSWDVFIAIEELFILVPALMGLKGNLDMTLASRLSTQANLGNMVIPKEIFHIVLGNIALVQIQAIVAGFIVAMFSITVGYSINGGFVFNHAVLVVASSIFTATVSCFFLDFILVAFILFSVKFKTNPDNMVTPLAASIGDIVSVSLLSFIASSLFKIIDKSLWIAFVLIGAFLILLPIWIFIVLRNRYTRPVLKSGWLPVLSALIISGSGGLVLMKAVSEFSDYEVFSPIINGIGGNLVSIQASRIATLLHQCSKPGVLPSYGRVFENPLKTLIKGTPYAKSSRILILISIPGQTLFIFLADFIHMSKSTIGAPFFLTYLTVSTLQVIFLLFSAHVIIHAMWRNKIDPDSSAIPYLTALGDVIGSCLLLGAFAFLRVIGHEYGLVESYGDK